MNSQCASKSWQIDSLTQLFADFANHLESPESLAAARHADFPTAFTRRRQLPLPTLVATLLCGMCASMQAELDQFFAHIRQRATLCRHVSEQAFAQARAKLSANAFDGLNRWLIERADSWVPRWKGLRLVAADASHLQFGIRASHVPRGLTWVDWVSTALFGAFIVLYRLPHISYY